MYIRSLPHTTFQEMLEINSRNRQPHLGLRDVNIKLKRLASAVNFGKCLLQRCFERVCEYTNVWKHMENEKNKKGEKNRLNYRH